MSYGLILYSPDGTKEILNTSSFGGVFVMKLILPTTGSGTVVFNGTNNWDNGGSAIVLPKVTYKSAGQLYWVVTQNGDQEWSEVSTGSSGFSAIQYYQQNLGTFNTTRFTSTLMVFTK